MDWQNLPSLNSLRAFSVLAETGSYANAAKRLNVTYPAVSQQVKALEERIDTTLIIREGRSPRLTEEGSKLAHDMAIAFSAISRGVTNVRKNDVLRPVQITTSPAFSVEWLMPRIMEFQRLHPDIMLMLNPTVDVVQLVPGGVDFAIRYRDKNRLKDDVPAVLVTDMVVIGSPVLLAQYDLDGPRSLLHLPWLQEFGTNEAVNWFERRGIEVETLLMVTQMPGNLIMQSDRRGDGITYTSRAFFRNEIDAGQIKVLYSEPVFGVYCLETNPSTSRPAVRKFINWIMSNAEIVTV